MDASPNAPKIWNGAVLSTTTHPTRRQSVKSFVIQTLETIGDILKQDVPCTYSILKFPWLSNSHN